jgi:hypothetical protein
MVNNLMHYYGDIRDKIFQNKLRRHFAAPSTISLSTVDHLAYVDGEIDDLISFVSDESKPSRRSRHSDNIFNMHGLNRLKTTMNLAKAGVKGNSEYNDSLLALQ